MQVLEDLYMGDIHPSERSFKKDSQYSRALNEVVKAGDALLGTLNEKQKEQVQAYIKAQLDKLQKEAESEDHEPEEMFADKDESFAADVEAEEGAEPAKEKSKCFQKKR